MNFIADIFRVRRILEAKDTRGMRESALAGLVFGSGYMVFGFTESWFWVVMVTVPLIVSVLYVTRPRPVMSLSITEQQNDRHRDEVRPVADRRS